MKGSKYLTDMTQKLMHDLQLDKTAEMKIRHRLSIVYHKGRIAGEKIALNSIVEEIGEKVKSLNIQDYRR